jgi:hypothetical protein
VRVITAVFASLCITASAAAADPLRHVEYAVTTQLDGRASTSHLVLDLVGTTSDRGITLDVVQADGSTPLRVDVDKHGIVTAQTSQGALTREAALLVYFFALGAQNMTGLGRGDEWAADGATGDGAQHSTRFVVVRTPLAGRLDIAFTRSLDIAAEHDTYRGRLLYDAFKVVPVSFDAGGAIRALEDGVERTHEVRLAMRLIKDSQP